MRESEKIKIQKLLEEHTKLLSEQNNVIYEQNKELLLSIQHLSNENKELKILNQDSNQILKDLQEYKNQKQREEQLRLERRQKRLDAKKRPPSLPISNEEYTIIIEHLKHHPKLSRTKKARYIVLSYLLMLTGCRISEILSITADCIYFLFNSNYIPIDRFKGGPKQHKAFITQAGKNLLQNIKEELFRVLSDSDISVYDFSDKKLNVVELSKQYLFKSRNSNTPMTRASINYEFNNILKEISYFKEKKMRFTSHSFRRGYITNLWKNREILNLFVKL